MVKRNNGRDIRMTSANTILGWLQGEREVDEIEIIDAEQRDLENEMFQEGYMLWISPFHKLMYEATRDDKQAEKEYQLCKQTIKRIPDVDPVLGNHGTLVRIYGESLRTGDGSIRIVKYDPKRKTNC